MAWWDHAKPGDPLVCVDAYEGLPIMYPGSWPLRQGAVYRMSHINDLGDARRVGPYMDLSFEVVLFGVKNPGKNADGFSVLRFRPAQTSDLPSEVRNLLKLPVWEDA